MAIEVILHGALLGNGQIITNSSDQICLESFYQNNSEFDEQMLVEVVRTGPNGPATYYNYLRYNTIFSHRPGSYFGFSIRFDGQIYLDVKILYNIVTKIFYSQIVGKAFELLPPENGKAKYRYKTETKEEFEDLARCVETQFGKMFTPFYECEESDRVSSIDKYVSDGEYRINPADLSIENAKQLFSNKKKIRISPDVPYLAIKSQVDSINAKAKRLIGEAEKRAEEADSQRNSAAELRKKAEAEVERLNQELTTAKATIKEKEGVVTDLKTQKAKLEGDIQQKVGSINSLEQTVANLKNEKATFQSDVLKKLNGLDSGVNDLGAKTDSLKTDILSEIGAYNAKFDAVDSNLENVKAGIVGEVKPFGPKLKEVCSGLESLKTDLGQKTQQIESLQGRLAALQQHLAESEAQVQSELSLIQPRFDELVSLIGELKPAEEEENGCEAVVAEAGVAAPTEEDAAPVGEDDGPLMVESTISEEIPTEDAPADDTPAVEKTKEEVSPAEDQQNVSSIDGVDTTAVNEPVNK